MHDSDTPVDQLADMVATAHNVVVFTGAGLSTESGIPDFRSPGGIWSRMRPIQFDEFVSDESARHEAWRRVFSGERGLRGVQPNRGHDVIAHWAQAGKANAIITQNVDNLHQASGVADEQVIELHGNAGHASCLQCGRRVELADLAPEFEQIGRISPCNHCGGLLKLATISFGQPMPEAEMKRATRETLGCDLFLAIGSSLQVQPAAGFPATARQAGARLVIINRETTPLDSQADLVIQGEIGDILARTTEAGTR